MKFYPVLGAASIRIDGEMTNIFTEHQCITAMETYKNKSLEELRLEDMSVKR